MAHARAPWLLVGLAVVGFEAFLLVEPGTGESFAVSVGLLLALDGLVAGIVALRRAAAELGPLRPGWRYLGAACLFFSAGQVAFALETASTGSRPATGTSVADLLTALAVPFALTGLVAFAGPTVTSRAVTILDGAIVSVALVFVSWAVVLGPVYRESGTTRAEVTTLVYVGGTLAMLAMVLVLSMRWRGDMHELILLGLCFAWLSASNAGYGVTNLRGTYEAGDWRIDIGWFASLLLLALAAARPPRAAAVDVRHRWWLTLFVPYTAMLLVLLTVSGRLLVGRHLDGFLEAAGTLGVALVLARQVVTLREHHRLTVDLEGKVSERTAAAQRYASQLRALLRDSSDVLAVVDEHGTFAYVSPACWSLFGVPAEDVLGQPFLAFVHPEDQEATRDALLRAAPGDTAAHVVTFRLATNKHHWCDVEATFSAVRGDLPGAGVLLNMRDVTERTAEQQQLRQQALVDPLTSLPNRRVFDDRVRHALDRADRSGESVSVLFVDLDHFKRVNDTAGHAVGDELLVQVADRLRTCLRPADTAARLGGDEFAILLEDTNASQAEEVASRVVAALSPPFELSDRTLAMTASVGVTSSQAGATTRPELVHDADVAMYRAKARGRGRVEVFGAPEDARLSELHTDLDDALEAGAVGTSYQPLVDLTTGAVTGLEVTLHWAPAPGEELARQEPRASLDDSGLAPRLDRWLLREACRQVRSWQDLLPRYAGLQAHVNLTAAEPHDPTFVSDLAKILQETGLAPEALVLELPERGVLPGDAVVTEFVHGLHGLGASVWVDDFGTGFASLATLQEFPVQGLKLAPSLVADMESGQRGRRVVSALLHMAHAVGVRPVAVGVETPRQEKYLVRMGCGGAQGPLYSPSLSQQEVATFLVRSTQGLLRSPGRTAQDGADGGS